jgi:hypothetical protein
LAQANEVREGVLIDPFPTHDELFTEVSDVSDRATEAANSQFQENPKYFSRRIRTSRFLIARGIGFREGILGVHFGSPGKHIIHYRFPIKALLQPSKCFVCGL